MTLEAQVIITSSMKPSLILASAPADPILVLMVHFTVVFSMALGSTVCHHLCGSSGAHTYYMKTLINEPTAWPGHMTVETVIYPVEVYHWRSQPRTDLLGGTAMVDTGHQVSTE